MVQNLDFPVFPLNFYDAETGETYKGYKEEGYFPKLSLIFSALLGWSPADDKEILNVWKKWQLNLIFIKFTKLELDSPKKKQNGLITNIFKEIQ